jgi:hypothetical protein
MSERTRVGQVSLFGRAACVAFTFLMMNCSAVVGLAAVLMRKKVWR